MPPIRQPSFAAGELAPLFWGRSDLAKYASGCRRLKNFVVSKTGAAVSRPGTWFVALTRNPTNIANPRRMIPFVFSEELVNQAYVVVFGDGFIRFLAAGGEVVTGGGAPYEIAHPYLPADLLRLKYVQSGDVLYLVHPNHPVRMLRRLGHTNWTLTPLEFDARPFESPSDPRIVGDPIAGADATHPAKEWIYAVTVIMEDELGTRFETAPFVVTQSKTAVGWPQPSSAIIGNQVVSYPDLPITLDWASSGLFGPTWKVISFRVYKGRGGLFGVIGETRTFTFVDYGQEPDYSRAPPQGRNPFKVYGPGPGGVGALLRTEEPGTIALFDQRLCFGGTVERPGTIFASAVGDWANFDDRVPSVSDEALEFELASQGHQQIRSLVGTKRLYAFTGTGVWAISGAGGAPLSATEVPDAREQVSVGASWLDPLVIGDNALYVRTKGYGVRDVFFENERGGYTGNDISLFAQHLFAKRQIQRWAYAEDPWGVVWAVRDDAKLLSLTYDRDHDLFAWTYHETDGEVLDVCTIPEGVEDAVYLLVRRRIGGTQHDVIERMAPRDIDGAWQDNLQLDSASDYDDLPTSVITGLDHLEGKSVYGVADGNVVGPFDVVGGQVVLPEEASRVFIGLRYERDIELLDLGDERGRVKSVGKVWFEVIGSRGLWAGEGFDTLTEWDQRTVADDYGPIGAFTGLVEIAIESSWNLHGRAVLRQVDPLPITVLGATREVEFGGR